LHDLTAIDNTDDIYTDIATRLLNGQLENGMIPDSLYFETANQLQDAMNSGLAGKGLTSVAYDFEDSRNILKSYLTRNIYHFSAAKSLTEMLEYRNLMYDNSGQILSFSKFRKAVSDKGKIFNDVYLQTEYDTALQSSIMAHRWDTMQSEYLEFSTVGDGRVRPEHATLDGLTYPKSHPIWNRMYPPLAWNCRCTVIPGIASKYDSKDEIAVEKQVAASVKGTIFDNNVGKSRLIFKDGHPYYNSLKHPLDYKNYGLLPIDKIEEKGGLKPVSKLNSKDEYDVFWKQKTNHDKGIVISDPLNQTVLFPDQSLTKKGKPNDSFRDHLLSRKNEPERYKLVANIEDIIKKPDEIWSVLKRGDKNPLTTHYIKYYDGDPMLVVTVENEAKTIFSLNETGYSTRKGILLYRKTK
jgi:SPP1 gp7 family putative phage head morphogenesis protein